MGFSAHAAALLGLFATSLGIAFSGAVMPGPVLLATVRWSARYGRWVGPLMIVGHALVEVPLIVAVVLGLGEWLTQDTVKGVLGLAGCGMLALMAVLMVRGLPRLHLPAPEKPEGSRDRVDVARVIASGAVTSLSNPYFPGWWLAIGLPILAVARPYGLMGYAVFYAGHVLADLIWYGAVSESMHRGRRLLSDRGYRWLVGVCAGLLFVFAVLFGWAGARFLAGNAS